MSDRDAFERAFIAVTYLLGKRHGLADGLGPECGQSATELVARLAVNDQSTRARVLAAELLAVADAFEARGLV